MIRMDPQEWEETFVHEEQRWSKSKDYTFTHNKGRAPDEIYIQLGPNYMMQYINLAEYDRRWRFTFPDSNTVAVKLFKISELPPKKIWTRAGFIGYSLTIKFIWL